jgi:hypothetical protein
MGELLSTFPWRVYLTWTFRDRIGPEGALREIRAHLRLFEFGFGREVGWVVGLEQEPGAPWPHAHGLLCGDRVVEPVTLYKGRAHERTVPLLEPYWRAWFDRHGSAKFEVIEGDARGCSFYCAKYATKRGELYFSPNLHEFRGSGAPIRALTLFPNEVSADGRGHRET